MKPSKLLQSHRAFFFFFNFYSYYFLFFCNSLLIPLPNAAARIFIFTSCQSHLNTVHVALQIRQDTAIVQFHLVDMAGDFLFFFFAQIFLVRVRPRGRRAVAALLSSPPTCVGTGGESSRGEASCASSSRWRCCCYLPSWQIGSSPCSCQPPPLGTLTSDPWAPTSCSYHGTYPVDRLGLGAAPCTC